MAKVFRYGMQPLNARFNSLSGAVEYKLSDQRIPDVPWISWKSGVLWVEASLFLAETCVHKFNLSKKNDSAISDASHLKAYADFLESNSFVWNYFPEEKYKRATYLFRGHLIKLREKRKYANSTISARISAVRRFYIWSIRNNLLDSNSHSPFELERKTFRFINSFGVQQVQSVVTSDLSISNRKVNSNSPEDGLYPIKASDRDLLFNACEGVVTHEFFLMLKLGFFSGMRIGTIIDLKVSSLQQAFDSKWMVNAKSIGVGPNFGISTKDEVEYYPSIPTELWKELMSYCGSVRRLVRQGKATDEIKDLVFITQRGDKYKVNSNQRQMEKMRLIAPTLGLDLSNFYFHCTRATFGSKVVDDMMKSGHANAKILAALMGLMGHVSSESSMRYVKFVEDGAKYEQICADWSEKWQ